jgi:mannan endo-1,4-beta-mannosidase
MSLLKAGFASMVAMLAATILAHSSAAQTRDAMAQPGSFVRAEGNHFVLNGHRLNVAGVNNHYLAFGSRQEVVRVLDDAMAMNANVVRTFIQPVIGSPDGRGAPTIWDWRNQTISSDLGVHSVYILSWDDRAGKMEINDGPNGLQRLDFLVAEAGSRHLRLILAFVDFWAYTGGIQQMRAWYGGQDKNRFFFADPRTREDYRRFVEHVLLRRNTITGVVYRDDPTILAWDLANEPNIEPPALMRSWEDDMARFVKLIDPNHLVTSGRANMHVSNTDFDVRALDFLTWHGYPSYLGIPADQFDQAILAHCAAGRAPGKPVLLEEFGNSRHDGNQAAIYAKWLNTIEMEPDCAGWVVWRVVSRQDDGAYPADNVDGFDIHNDGGASWLVLQKAARRYAWPSAQ